MCRVVKEDQSASERNTWGRPEEDVCVQALLNYIFVLKDSKSGGLGVVLLGKLAHLSCLDKKILHMESITFYCKQHKNLYFLRPLG